MKYCMNTETKGSHLKSIFFVIREVLSHVNIQKSKLQIRNARDLYDGLEGFICINPSLTS